MNPGRAAKLNRTVFNNHFNKLEEIIVELDVTNKPQCTYNVDDKGCILCLHKEPHVYAEKDSKHVHIIGRSMEKMSQLFNVKMI